jgi:hypothetical protein
MDTPEVFFHLDHLPALDQYYIDQGHTARYQYPSVNYHSIKKTVLQLEDTDKSITSRIIDENVISTPSSVQNRVEFNEHDRHNKRSRTISSSSDFHQSKFAQDLISDLGEVGSSYFYNPPWGLYDWHRDLSKHDCAINFLLTDTPDARTMFRFPTNCGLNYKLSLLEYELYRPVLIHAKTEHCVANLTNQHRYILSLVLFDASYTQAKEWLLKYNCSSYN